LLPKSPFGFLGAKDPRQARLAPGTFDGSQERVGVSLEKLAKEGVKGINGDVDGRSGQVTFGDQMEEPSMHLRGGEQVGGFVMELRQIGDEGGVGLNGSLSQALESEELDEFLA
jgi:hypothetical protein